MSDACVAVVRGKNDVAGKMTHGPLSGPIQDQIGWENTYDVAVRAVAGDLRVGVGDALTTANVSP